MYVYIYICKFIYIHITFVIHIYMVYMYIHVHVHVHIRISIRTHVYVYGRLDTSTSPNQHIEPNRSSSKPRSRTILLMYLCTIQGGCWLLEQPSGSVLEYYPTFRQMLRMHYEFAGIYAVGSSFASEAP